jgi:hypothetical protein
MTLAPGDRRDHRHLVAGLEHARGIGVAEVDGDER